MRRIKEQRATLDELDALLDEMLEESGGPMTIAERRADRLILGWRRATKR